MKRVALFALVATVVLSGTGCGTTRPRTPGIAPDPYFERVIASAGAAFERGDVERAATLYESAWQRARAMDRPEAIGMAAYNLALCRIALNQPTEGRALLEEVRAEWGRAGVSLIDALLVEVEAARHMGDEEGAWELSEEALGLLEGRRERLARVQVHAMRSVLATEREHVDIAEEELALARSALRRDTPFPLRARVAEAEGRARAAVCEPQEAASAFDREARYYRDAGQFTDMAVALTRAARSWQMADAHAAAADRFYRAARHYAATGQSARALGLMQEALVSLEILDEDGAEVQRSMRLIEEISDSVKQHRGEDV